MGKKNILSMRDFTAEELLSLLDLAHTMKAELKAEGKNEAVCAGKCLVMIFEKPSLRTRLSFEVGMAQLGGHAIHLTAQEIGIDSREPAGDVGRVVSSMGDLIMARTCAHETLVGLAGSSTVSVINGLSDLEHPCQILADLLTITEAKGALRGIKLAYFGDGENNVTHSLALAAGLLGMHFVAASPRGYWMKEEVAAHAQGLCRASGGTVAQTDDPEAAALDADIIYTDTWVSMGDEAEREKRLGVFPPYQVTAALMRRAKPDARFMHDLPAYRGNEVAAEVIDGRQSLVWQQAENRLHAQKALMAQLLDRHSFQQN